MLLLPLSLSLFLSLFPARNSRFKFDLEREILPELVLIAELDKAVFHYEDKIRCLLLAISIKDEQQISLQDPMSRPPSKVLKPRLESEEFSSNVEQSIIICLLTTRRKPLEGP